MTLRTSLILAACLLLGTACGSDTPGPVVGEDLKNLAADNVTYGVRSILTADGMRRAIIDADSAYSYDDEGRIQFFGPRVQFFNEFGAQSGRLTADSGTLDLRTEAMTVRGNVVLITLETNRRIESSELNFDPPADRIWSDSATTIYENGTVMRGEGFTSDGKLANVRLIRPTGRIEGVRIEF